MAFTIPNDVAGGTAEQHAQASPDTVDIGILVAALKGDGVVSGCGVTSNANMTPSVAAGAIQIGGTNITVSGGTVTVTTADATNPRFDLVAVNTSGAKSVVAGTAAASPVFPAIPANSIILAAMYVAAGATAINSADIIDKGCLVQAGGKQHLWIDSAEMCPRLTNGPSRGVTEAATNKNLYETLDFDQTTQEFAQFRRVMPKSWNEDTVSFIPYWTAASGSGGVVFALQGVAASNDDAIDVAFGTEQTSTDTLLAVGDCHAGPESSAITIAGTPAANDLVMFQIKRNPADASDTLAADAKLMGILLIITSNADTDT